MVSNIFYVHPYLGKIPSIYFSNGLKLQPPTTSQKHSLKLTKNHPKNGGFSIGISWIPEGPYFHQVFFSPLVKYDSSTCSVPCKKVPSPTPNEVGKREKGSRSLGVNTGVW